MAIILHIWEGVTQIYPLAMVAYVIGMIPLTKRHNSTYPDIIQPWYTGDSESLGTFNDLEKYFKVLRNN